MNTTDQKIDAALKPTILTDPWQNLEDGSAERTRHVTVSNVSGVDILCVDTLRDGKVTPGSWTVWVEVPVMGTHGQLQSTAQARMIAADLEAAAQLADRLNTEEAGR